MGGAARNTTEHTLHMWISDWESNVEDESAAAESRVQRDCVWIDLAMKWGREVVGVEV